MTNTDTAALDAHYAALRSWANGLNTYVAATEILIRAGWAQPWRPWIHEEDGRPWVDFAAIPDLIGAYSGGEQRILRIAASLAESDVRISLGDNLAGLEHWHVRLALAACAHAAGYGEVIRVPEFDEATGVPTWVEKAGLAVWPDNTEER